MPASLPAASSSVGIKLGSMYKFKSPLSSTYYVQCTYEYKMSKNLGREFSRA